MRRGAKPLTIGTWSAQGPPSIRALGKGSAVKLIRVFFGEVWDWIPPVEGRFDCPECFGRGTYPYDLTHVQPCADCCPHDQGVVRLSSDDFPEVKGRWACVVGCGTTWETQRSYYTDRGTIEPG